MTRRFPDKRLTLTQLQAAVNLYKPADGFARELDFMSETPRKQSTEPRKHEESTFLHGLLKVAKDYYHTGLSRVWLRRNNNMKVRSLDNKRILSAGLGTGTSDGIGYVVQIVTPEMVGSLIARFLAIEAKAKGKKADDNQEAFLKQVNDDGGIGLVATDGDDVHALIKGLPNKK
jgi:hypothetical protein